MKNTLFILMLILFFNSFLLAVIEETASFKNFLYGSAPECEYDNWMSHIAEGIASPGYNLYAPWERQTNGFGDFQIPSEEQLTNWEGIVTLFLINELEAAQDSIDSYEFPYQVVIFHDTDTDRTYHILREIPNYGFYDDNGTIFLDDDEFGAFAFGWGLYVYFPDGPYPHITTAPHPNDDYSTVPFSYEVFREQQSKFLLISGVGREVTWTEVGNYTNSKSTCDPSRVAAHPYNVAYQQFCDWIRAEFGQREFSIQVHSYDWGSRHAGYANVQISAGYSLGNPDLPIRDHSSLKKDIVNATDFVVHPANTIGIHPPVFINDFYAIHYSEYDFYYENEDHSFVVNNQIDLQGYSSNRQMLYTHAGHNQYENFQPFFHLEMDELPNVYPQNTQNYHWFYGWNAATNSWDYFHLFDKYLDYYSPWNLALSSILPDLYEMNDGLVPEAPSNLTVITECADYIVLEWTIGDCYDLDSYEIYFAEEPISDDNYDIRDKSIDSKLATLAQNQHTVSGLNTAEDYYFQIRIRDKNGNYSSLSNEVMANTGPAKITYLKTYGKDDLVEISFYTNFQENCSGFNIYRKTAQTDFILIDSWDINPDLIGTEEDNFTYNIIDNNVENGEFYTYKISSVDLSGQEFFYGSLGTASPQKIYQIVANQTFGAYRDTCFFGFNTSASDGYDYGTYDILTGDEATENYLFCQFFETDWNTSVDELQQEIFGFYDTETNYKHWVFRVKTDQLNVPYEIGISNLGRDSERFYLEINNTWTNLNNENYTFNPTSNGFYTFDLYFGNLTPSIEIANMVNQLYFPNEQVTFNWNLNIQESIDHINIFAENDEISIPIDMNLSPDTSEIYWSVPQLIFDNLKLKIDLIMVEGDTLSYYSPYKFGIVTPQTIISLEEGWNLISQNFEMGNYTTEEVYGNGSELYDWVENEFIQIETPEFLKPYWINEPQDNYFTINYADIQKSAYDYQLQQGWNIVPNPHHTSYDLHQLIFVMDNENFEYYQAIQNNLIEPFMFAYDDRFIPTSHLESAKSYYLFCYEDNLTLRFIPFYSSTFSPDFNNDWKIEIKANQNNEISSSVIVGTSSVADSLYDSIYDLLKPVNSPFENNLLFYLPQDFNDDGIMEYYHQLINNPLNTNNEFYYEWISQIELNSLETINFEIFTENLPENHFVYLKNGDNYIQLSEAEIVDFTPNNNILNLSIIVTDQIFTETDENIISAVASLKNFPNPFNPTTNISFSIPEKNEVEITIYNIKGQKVKTVLHDKIPAGIHNIAWSGKDSNNRDVATGVYFCKLKVSNSKTIINKMLLLK
ncbi:MAG: T9SS type A sorting domain-containing protein [Candidatus Cloacimonetes bacterium]|nr:T9SS type A sorting domain-containing protein [Candidatus Cloacimonadota bacterium]